MFLMIDDQLTYPIKTDALEGVIFTRHCGCVNINDFLRSNIQPIPRLSTKHVESMIRQYDEMTRRNEESEEPTFESDEMLNLRFHMQELVIYAIAKDLCEESPQALAEYALTIDK
jgi:hypothetical protein